MIKFDINGAIIEFDEKMDSYNSIRRLFKTYAEDTSIRYENICKENTMSIKRLLDVSTRISEALVDEVIRKSIECIVSYGVIDVDFDTFKNTYCKKYIDWDRLLNNINKEILTQNKNKKNRVIYEFNSIVKKMSKNIYNDCFNIHLAVIDVLVDNKVNNVSNYINDEDIKRASALFNNYRDGFITKPDECRVVKQIITLNPYRNDVYEFLMKEDGDFNGEVERIAEYIGYDIKPYKTTLMDIYINTLVEDETSEIDLAKEKLAKYCKYIGFKEDKAYLEKIDSVFSLKSEI